MAACDAASAGSSSGAGGLDVVDDALVGAQRAQRERRRRRHGDLDQARIAQRALQRQRIPARVFEQLQRQCEGRVAACAVALRCGEQRANARVELGRSAQQQHVTLEIAEAETLREQHQRRRRITLRGRSARRLRGRESVGLRRHL
jgi:hypothetical protein